MGIVTTPQAIGIKREIVYRIQIGIFWLLCMLLANTILQPVSNGVLYFAVAALIELFIIQAMRGLFGDTPLIRDACEVNFYCFLVHLIAIPVYLNGIKSIYHNNAINAFWCIYALRLCYFGEKRANGEYGGWAKFGALGCIHQLIRKYGNNRLGRHLLYIGKTVIVLGTVIPLWLITIQTNDQSTSLFTILATAFILIYGYWKSLAASRSRDLADRLLNDETIALCKAYNQRSGDARMLIRQMVLQDFSVHDLNSHVQQTLAKAERTRRRAMVVRARVIKRLIKFRQAHEIDRIFTGFVVYGVTLGFLCWVLTFNGVLEQTRLVSYVTGYIDAKTGRPARSETDIAKILECIAIKNSERPMPPSPQCSKYLKFEK